MENLVVRENFCWLLLLLTKNRNGWAILQQLQICQKKKTESFSTSVARTVVTDAIVHKVAIVGGGPAANTAAIYTARARLNPVMYEGFMAAGIAAGGQLTSTTDIENFPGWPDAVQGCELMERMRQQAINCGTNIITETVAGCELSQRPFTLQLENGSKVLAESIIIATGAAYRRLGIPGEETYWQAGISTCAVCDGAAPIFRKKTVAVVGGGDVACEEASFMTRFCNRVLLIVMLPELNASAVMQERVLNEPKIDILYCTVVLEARGDGKKLQNILVKSTKTEQTEELQTSGLFYAIGQTPNTDWLGGQIQLDEQKFIVTKPNSTLTSVEGVFAAGDVMDKVYRQAIVAAGCGAKAAMECERWLDAELGKRRTATIKKEKEAQAQAEK
eukprot:TRINITY_DN35552_c0_g1_i1.p1 TRINITY_DN35552_c0_g1~~TRINITY_DN35552_c0_g1_i1.p1  ORF type:complete len:389 (-),score=43.35 TRINITY_DN35552_c0_g1_i1:88-1254(-)